MIIRKKFKLSFPLCLITVFLVSFLGPTNGSTKEEKVAAPVKFVVISNTFDKPEFAKVLLCESFSNSGIVINVKTTDGKKEQLMAKDTKQVVKVPDLRFDIVQPFQFDAINSCLDELTKVTKTYPRLRDSLLPLGKEMKTIVDSGAQGFVRRNGKWEKATAPTPASAGMVIREVKGKEYRNAKIKRVEPDGLMVLHESGLSKVFFVNLSKEIQDKYNFDPIEAEKFRKARETKMVAKVSEPKPVVTEPKPVVTKPTPVTEPTPPPTESPKKTVTARSAGWHPSSVQDVAACTLLAENNGGLSNGGSSGTAFLCNENGATYIYTNMHVIHAAKRLVFKDSDGEIYNDIAGVEIPAKPWGKWVQSKSQIKGGDLVRFRLTAFRDKALTIKAGNQKPVIGGDIIIAGNRSGKGKVVVAVGKIKSVVDGQIIHHDAPIAAGNSGGAIVDADSMEVIGLLTWGPKSINARRSVWEKGILIEKGGGIGFGTSFHVTPKWIKTTPGKLLEESFLFEELKQKIRVLGFLNVIEPTVDGLFISPEKEVEYGVTVEQILKEGEGDSGVRYLMGLHNKLAKNRKSKIRMSLQDVYKNYSNALRYAWQDTTLDRETLERRSKPFFYECYYYNSNLFGVSKIYEDTINSAHTWYEKQLGVGSVIILGDRPVLPALDTPVWNKVID